MDGAERRLNGGWKNRGHVAFQSQRDFRQAVVIGKAAIDDNVRRTALRGNSKFAGIGSWPVGSR